MTSSSIVSVAPVGMPGPIGLTTSFGTIQETPALSPEDLIKDCSIWEKNKLQQFVNEKLRSHIDEPNLKIDVSNFTWRTRQYVKQKLEAKGWEIKEYKLSWFWRILCFGETYHWRIQPNLDYLLKAPSSITRIESTLGEDLETTRLSQAPPPNLISESLGIS